jgi:hypothetical protein
MTRTEYARLIEPPRPIYSPGRVPEAQAIAEALPMMVRRRCPRTHEIFYHHALGDGPSKSGFERFLYIAAQRLYVNLGFF